MSTAVLTFTPEFGLQEDVEFSTLVFQADSGREKRRAKWSRPIRTVSCSLNNQSDVGIGLMYLSSVQSKDSGIGCTSRNPVVRRNALSACRVASQPPCVLFASAA